MKMTVDDWFNYRPTVKVYSEPLEAEEGGEDIDFSDLEVDLEF